MPVESVTIAQISDMNPYGFARALVDVMLTPSVLSASAKISVDVPLQYTGDINVAELRAKVLHAVIASLRDAAENVPQEPVPLHPAQPESAET